MRTNQLFISYSWAYSDANKRLVGLLNKRRCFRFKDYSLPRHDPIVRSIAALRARIRQRMAPCVVF